MNAKTNFSNFRNHLRSCLDTICDEDRTLRVQRRNAPDVVVIPLKKYEDLNKRALRQGYAAMSKDKEREQEADEWCENLSADIWS